jgi:predicted nucleic acid-binding protein
MVVFDTSVLTLAFDPSAKAPVDPATGLVLSDAQVRIDHLLKTLGMTKERVLIPAPVLSEYLVRGGEDKDKRLDEITSSRVFVVAPFDTRAAVECAAIEAGGPRRNRVLTEDETKAKVKFDRQIIAVAIVRGVSVIYTGDRKLAATARLNGIGAVLTWELELPPVDPQLELSYEVSETDEVQKSLTEEWSSY